MNRVLGGLALTLAALLPGLASAASITLNNIDASGTGLNDTTAFTPVGGNTASTLGQARLNVLNRAAELWGARLVSGPSIVIDVSFAAFSSSQCTSRSGTLAQTGPDYIFENFSGAPLANVFYTVAQANALSGRDLGSGAEISADFNGSVDSDPNCLGGVGFYYGLDNQPGSQIDLLNVAAHEFAHGLGFLSLVDLSTGSGPDSSAPNRLGIYDQYVYDESRSSYWPLLSSAQRLSSAASSTQLSFNASSTNAQVGALTAGTTNGHLRLYAPSSISSGSSVSHWDTTASPNLLMEPFITSTIAASEGMDFTTCLLKDIGWTLASGVGCPDTAATTTPTVTLSLASASLVLGNSTTLSWSSSNASSCTATGAWTGSRAISGSEVLTPTAAGSYTYTLSCTNGTTSNSASKTLTVTAPLPTVSISVSPTLISLGNSATVSWSSSDANTCVAIGAWSGNQTTAGSFSVTPSQTGTYTYGLSCTNNNGSTAAQATLTVTVPAPTVSISVSPSSITLGGSATLSWTSSNASTCNASGAWTGSQTSAGSSTVTPSQTGSYTYGYSCTNSGGTSATQAILTVTAASSSSSSGSSSSGDSSGGGGGGFSAGLLSLLAGIATLRRRYRR